MCTTTEDFDIQAGQLQVHLLERGYSRSLLKKVYHRARREKRHLLLYRNSSVNQTTGRSRDTTTPKTVTHPTNLEPTGCILTYSSQHHSIRSIIDKYWFLLTEDSILSLLSLYVSPKPSVAYQRCRSLKDDLVHSHYLDNQSLPKPPSLATVP